MGCPVVSALEVLQSCVYVVLRDVVRWEMVVLVGVGLHHLGGLLQQICDSVILKLNLEMLSR